MLNSVACVVVFILSCVNGANYEPSDTVKMVNAYPHFTPTDMQSTSNTFNDGDDYLMGTVGLPAYVTALGIVSLVLLPFLLCLRCCCHCMKCAPGASNELWIDKDGRHRFKKNVWIFGAYYLTCVLALVFVHLLWMASASFSEAIVSASDALGDLEDLFQELSDDSVEAGSAIDDTNAALDNIADDDANVCQPDSTITDALDLLDGTVTDLATYTDKLPGYMADGITNVETGEYWQRLVLFCCYASIMGVLIFYVALAVCQSKCGLKVAMPLTWVIVLALTVVCGIEMWIVMITCDFCYSPEDSILSSLDSDSTLYQTISDYVTRDANGDACTNSANAELQKYITDASEEFDDAMDAFDDSIDACALAGVNTDDLSDAKDDLENAIGDLFDTMDDLADCLVIHNLWKDVVEVSLCEHFAEGMFYFWLSKHLTALFLYLLLSLGSVAWQYMDVVPDDSLDDEEAAYEKFVAGGIVIKDEYIADQKKEKKVVELTNKAGKSRGRLKGMF